MNLTDDQIRRYARHIVLPEIGGVGQARLLAAKVLVVGAGGLGSPLLLYLAAAGIGTLGIVDFDRVDPSNLQRQVLFDEAATGELKVDAAAARLAALNPGVLVRRHALRLDSRNVRDLVRDYDLVADGSDNIETRRAVHDACMAAGRPLVAAAVQGTDGQLTTYKAYLGPPHPCLRCLFPDAPAREALPSCAQAGVLGPAAGVMGCLQAVEVVKELLGPPAPSLSGTLLLYDAMAARLDRLQVRRLPECALGCRHGGITADGSEANKISAV
ncbi:MAG: HesA/MoeB/ThiF family protein [Geminicoccaceae bacterium]|nr:HesA/MoeB/ThiF family protein [Geminicoccaceae bacterium]MCX8101208.1 HesA/MoeB/ThiF family protein [Geminicoccaceae bacterium]MDW8368957.1 HesA/MoeB/ThiF family protein [Geminicoccaceae bacterium]